MGPNRGGERFSSEISSQSIVFANFLIGTGTDVSNVLLFIATEEGSCDIVRAFIETGVDVNKQNKKCDTCLIVAAERGHNDCVNLLLEAGADVNRADRWDWSPLLRVVHEGVRKRDVLPRGSTVNPYYNGEVVKTLLAAGADVNYIQRFTSMTPAKLAATINNIHALKQFIEKGADINFVMQKSISALGTAISYDNAECMLTEFLKAGGNINIFRLIELDPFSRSNQNT